MRATTLGAAAFFLFASRLASGDGPPLLVGEVSGAGRVLLGRISLPKAGGVAATRFVFVSNEGQRLDAEVVSTPQRRRLRLSVGGASKLTFIQLREFVPAGPGVPTIILWGGERFLVTDPGPGRTGFRWSREAVAAAVATWISGRAPGLASLVAEAREVAVALASRSPRSLELPPGYAFNVLPLEGIELLVGPLGRILDPQVLSVTILPAAASRDLLARRPVWTEKPRRTEPTSRWSGAITGGREEKLGEIAATWQDDGVEKEAAVFWSYGAISETLRLKRDGDGLIRLTIERPASGSTSALLVLETIPGGGGDLWCEPWIVEDAKGGRRPVAIPPDPEAETERWRGLFFDAALEAGQSAGVSSADASRLLWRWYRILDSERLRSLVPELSGLADLLGWMPAPSFGPGDESAWLGAVRVIP